LKTVTISGRSGWTLSHVASRLEPGSRERTMHADAAVGGVGMQAGVAGR
jgi:hypothetical protein